MNCFHDVNRIIFRTIRKVEHLMFWFWTNGKLPRASSVPKVLSLNGINPSAQCAGRAHPEYVGLWESRRPKSRRPIGWPRSELDQRNLLHAEWRRYIRWMCSCKQHFENSPGQRSMARQTLHQLSFAPMFFCSIGSAHASRPLGPYALFELVTEDRAKWSFACFGF